jgi:hypothetical protein
MSGTPSPPCPPSGGNHVVGELQLWERPRYRLIQQLGDAPSFYKEFLDAGREGMQHISYWTTDYQALYGKALSVGYEVAAGWDGTDLIRQLN